MAQGGEQQFDLIVVGAGPGGYVAAIRAAQLGMRVALVERDALGGVCLNWGCIPTKSLLKCAEVYHTLQHAADYGLVAEQVGFNLGQVVARSRAVAQRLSEGVAYLLNKHKVTVISGQGRLLRPGQLQLSQGGKIQPGLAAPHIIFATGASPRALPGVEPDGKIIWGAREAMTPKSLPKSLLVIGSGAIGIEFASFYNSFGTQVTVLEALERILPQEDAEISDRARQDFTRCGITMHTAARLQKVQVQQRNAKVSWLDATGELQQASFDRVIVAVGVSANLADTGLLEAGVALQQGQVQVDPWGRTNIAGVYAIGDMTQPPLLAHKASHEAVICVEQIAGLAPQPLDRGNVPACTYSQPQIASVGYTQAQAEAEGLAINVGRFDLAASGKAQASGENRGLIKTIFDADSGELLGAHMIGPDVTELIQGYVVARNLESTELDLAETIFAHPTLSEAMHESVLDALGRVLHA